MKHFALSHSSVSAGTETQVTLIPKLGALSTQLGQGSVVREGMGLPAEWEPLHPFAPGELSAPCYLNSQLPALSTLRKAKGGRQGCWGADGTCDAKISVAPKTALPSRVWPVECRKEASGMDRVSGMERCQRQSRELQAETCPPAPPWASCDSSAVGPRHAGRGRGWLPASWGLLGPEIWNPWWGRVAQMPPTGLIRPTGSSKPLCCRPCL